MRVFISWSGDQSKQVAEALREWLPLIIQAIKPWVSAEDIEKGESWFTAIQTSLAEAKGMGIFCITPDNVVAPWLAFEAGVLSAHDKGRVATFLHNVEANGIRPPISLFQATRSTEKSDVFALLKSINSRLPDPLDHALLQRAFEANWSGLAMALSNIKSSSESTAPIKPQVILEEILNTVRRLERDAQLRALKELPLGAKRPSSSALQDMFEEASSGTRLANLARGESPFGGTFNSEGFGHATGAGGLHSAWSARARKDLEDGMNSVHTKIKKE